MKKAKRLLTSLLALFACTMMYAQAVISGTVTDDMGPVIGATVMEKGTSNGTVTDFDGNFQLKVAAGKTLVFSYVGCLTQELPAKQGMSVVMKEDAAQLDELVVIGYQTQRKADLTGAVGVMDMKKPLSEANANILNSMQGKMAGVTISTDAAPGGGGTQIRVRGMSTVNGNGPLYIIDGVPTTENLNSINAADIESMQVLKDASSASIYGSRAANGVIIITTKKGKGSKVSVNVTASGSLQTVAKSFDMLNAQQWGNAFWQANANDGLVASHPFYDVVGGAPVLKSEVAGTTLAGNHDWQDEVYHSAWTQNYGASVSNSGDKGSMLLSVNYNNQQGLMKESYFKRYTIRLNSNYKISNFISVGENMTIAKWDNLGQSTNADRGIPYTAMRQHPAIPTYNNVGGFANPMTMASSDIENPVQLLANGRDNENNSWRIFGNAYVELFPIKGMTLKSNLGVEHVQFLNQTLGRRVQASDMNSVSRGYGEGDTYTWSNTLNYDVTLGDKHHLTALAGTEYITYKFQDVSASRQNYSFEDKNYMVINAGSGTQVNGGGKNQWDLFSVFGKLDYGYADKYLASFTIRRDATSRLYKDNNSGVFPAFSLAWRFVEESFMKDLSWLNNGKLRFGWGQTGNSAIDNAYAYWSTYAYSTAAGYDLNGTNGSAVSGIILASSGNKDLKWETTTQTNIGLDLGLFNGLNISFDYYWKNTKDMLTIPPTLSVAGENAAMWLNTGKMKNHGWEVTVDYHSPKYGDFSWGGMLNVSSYKNEVSELSGTVSSMGSDIRLMEGQPMGVYYGYVADGLFNTQEEVDAYAVQQGKGLGRIKYRDINGDGFINDNDQCIIGDPNPDFSLGLSLDFNYKNWTLSTFLTGDFGFDIYNTTKRQLDFMNYGGVSTNRGTSILDAWTPTHTNTNIPALTLQDNNNETRMSTYYVEDGSYLKMKYVKLAYSFPEKMLKKTPISALSLYGQCENIFTITGYDGLDPELPMGSWGQRVDNAPYPIARTFSIGASITF